MLPPEPWKHPLPAHPATSPFNTKEYHNAIPYLKSFAERPKPHKERWADWAQTEMSIVHLFFLGMTERVYLYTGLISHFAEWAAEHDDLENHLTWAQVSLYGIYTHHHNEEDNLYPSWKEASGLDVWDLNVAEHAAFKAKLLTAFLYVKECRSALTPTPPPLVMPEVKELAEMNVSSAPTFDSSKSFDPLALRKQMEGWIRELTEHLKDEIETLKPEYVEKVGERRIIYDPSWFFVSALASTDWKSGYKLVGLPLFVRKVLIPFVWGPKHKQVWRYAAYPENLTFFGA